MNRPVQITYINSLLADAAYVNLREIDLITKTPLPTLLTGIPLLNALTADLTQPQATYLLANFDILTQTLSPTGGFDATVWKGKAGPEVAGQVFVSMRATAGSQDMADNAHLVTRDALLGAGPWLGNRCHKRSPN
jgi:hypothetical protein